MSTRPPLTVPGTLDSLKAIRDYVTEAAMAAQLDNLMSNRMRLAVDEIATNVVVHGYEEAGMEGNITIWAEIDDEQLVIVIEDSGPHFDPTQHKLPDEDQIGAALDTRDIGGLGIFLAVNGIDGFRYERYQNRNRNIFVAFRSTDDDNSS